MCWSLRFCFEEYIIHYMKLLLTVINCLKFYLFKSIYSHDVKDYKKYILV